MQRLVIELRIYHFFAFRLCDDFPGFCFLPDCLFDLPSPFDFGNFGPANDFLDGFPVGLEPVDFGPFLRSSRREALIALR